MSWQTVAMRLARPDPCQPAFLKNLHRTWGLFQILRHSGGTAALARQPLAAHPNLASLPANQGGMAVRQGAVEKSLGPNHHSSHTRQVEPIDLISSNGIPLVIVRIRLEVTDLHLRICQRVSPCRQSRYLRVHRRHYDVH